SNNITVGAAAATHFSISAPTSATAGSAFSFTVKALDGFNNLATGYSGTVHFTSTDGQAMLPADSTLASGAGTFSATLKTAGNQTITATDTVNNSVTGTSSAIAVSSVTPPPSVCAETSYVFPGGGGPRSVKGGFDVFGTLGQHDVAFSRGGAYTLDIGFWPSSASQTFIPASTPDGTNVTVQLGGITINFAGVTAPGLTRITPIDPCRP